MEVFLVIFSSLLGLIVGSFLNVAIRRGIRGESLFGRSHCESCNTTLTVFELIPVLSFILQRGKCRSCKSPFSWQYPLVELGSALAFAGVGYLFLPTDIFDWDLFLLAKVFLILVGISAAIVVFVVDIKEKIIPDGAFFILLGVSIGGAILRYSSFDQVYSFTGSLFLKDGITALALSGFFAALWFFSRGTWIGFGDVKLILATSMALGYPSSVAAFLFSFWLGGIGGGLLLMTRRASLKSQIPFGPFILMAAVIAYFIAPFFFRESRFLEGIYEIFSILG